MKEKRIYTVANQKGGVGKSTTCLSLGAALTEKGQKVLLLDLDPQGGLTVIAGMEPDSFDRTIYDSLLGEVPLSEVKTETEVDDLHLVPSSLDLSGATVELVEKEGWIDSLSETLKREGVGSEYSFIILDCPPSLGTLTTCALAAADVVIVPVQLEYLALKGLGQLNQIIEKVRRNHNPDLETRILRTMHDRRTRHTSEAGEEIENTFGGQVYETVINRTIKFADSTFSGQPITTYAPNSEAAKVYRKLAEEVIENG